ncbi:MAG: biopolymer transporter ExbD [Deltaproteobacteria bacterium]|nr:biopolymer transporter ExbD [Deltaproteobacteria bacterium]
MANPTDPSATPSTAPMVAADAPITAEDASALAAAKDRKRRRKHKRHGGHEELNIYSMLDLMTIILVFLIKQWQSDVITLSPDVQPPGSTITDKPSECVRVFIQKDRMLLDEKEVGRMQDGDVAPDSVDPNNPFLIPGLKRAMEDKAEQFLKIENAGGAKFEGKYAIVADRKIAWAMLKKVMFTAGQAAVVDQDGLERSFGDVRLITRKANE